MKPLSLEVWRCPLCEAWYAPRGEPCKAFICEGSYDWHPRRECVRFFAFEASPATVAELLEWTVRSPVPLMSYMDKPYGEET